MAQSIAAFAGSNAAYKIHTTRSDFEAAVFGLENAIVNRGLLAERKPRPALRGVTRHAISAPAAGGDRAAASDTQTNHPHR